MQISEEGRGVFHVTNHGETHIVDTLAYQGNGKCDCWPFTKFTKPEIDRLVAEGVFEPNRKYQCPHLQFADWTLLLKFKQELIKQFGDGNDHNQP